MRKLLSIIIVVCMIMVSVPISASATGVCTPYNGINVEAQTYDINASPVKSYLVNCNDGKLMRVQSYDRMNGVMVEYYDSTYNLLSSKVIPAELPIFGGFYSSNSNYFVVSGQTNYSEDDTAEVFRITKYDKDWNRMSSASVFGAKTTIPFNGGSARMVMTGDVLFIHTSHEMYASSDGYNHQANMTISVDTAQMKIIRAYTGGGHYVSHSFNQFIQIKDNNVVTIDHGDAFPRSIIMQIHKDDASKGWYGTTSAQISILKFPGSFGDNYTGASVGGFELSNSTYLVAGSTVTQNSTYKTNKTRNVFLAVSTGSKTTVNKFTSYAEGEKSASTPHLVKVNNNKFILLWSQNKTVYYMAVDANGKKISQIYSMEGNLSDCKPVIVGDKLVWYVWDDSKTIFNEINLNTLSSNNTVVLDNGHHYKVTGVSNGQATVQCTKCSALSTIPVATGMSIWWRTDNDKANTYYTTMRPDLKPGTNVDCKIKLSGPADYNSDIDVIVQDESIVTLDLKSKNNNIISGDLCCLKAGRTKITIRHRINTALAKTFEVEVGSNAEGISLSPTELTLRVNEKYTLQPVATPEGTSAMFSYRTSDYRIARVNGLTGEITAIKEGTADITVKTDNGLSVICKVTVVKDTLLGDVDNSGDITVADALMVMKCCVGTIQLDDNQLRAADTDKSGNVTVADTIKILAFIVGKITEF